MKGFRRASLAALAGLVVLAGCSTSDTAGAKAPASSAGEITVFAAASLKATFSEIGAQFEASHPGTAVRLNFAGSSDLVAQLQQGAPADVFASADLNTMGKAAAALLLAGSPTNFATNTLMVAVPPDNPAGIATFADLAKPRLQVVVCAPQVPCGAATEQVESSTGIAISPVSEESSVADVLNKVTTGEADAGVVYVTEVRGSGGKAKGIEIPVAVNEVSTYPIAVLSWSPMPALAEEFRAFVLGRQGLQILTAAGFGAP